MKKWLQIFLPLTVMICAIPLAILLWYTADYLDGSFLLLATIIKNHGVLDSMYAIFAPLFFGSTTAFLMLATFFLLQILLLRFHGIIAFLVTIVSFLGISFGLEIVPATIIYDNFGALLASLTIVTFAIAFIALCVPRPHFSLIRFFYGGELNSRTKNAKLLISSRLGIMSISLILISFGAKQAEIFGLSNSLLLSIFLTELYLMRFYLQETIYLNSYEMKYDRFGFYFCWRSLILTPVLYTLAALFLLHHPYTLSKSAAVGIFVLGVLAIFLSYDMRRQKHLFRQNPESYTHWKGKPLFISGFHVDDATHESLYLQSGYWGIARHIHCTAEILCVLAWSLPALFFHPLPYFSVFFLLAFYVRRIYRIEKTSLKKHKELYEAHMTAIPYRLIPLIW